jgi:hypothetical protein
VGAGPVLTVTTWLTGVREGKRTRQEPGVVDFNHDKFAHVDLISIFSFNSRFASPLCASSATSFASMRRSHMFELKTENATSRRST